MAKKKPKANKTQVIKEYLAANPHTAPKDVAAALNEQGLDVTPNYVSTIKTNMKSKGKGKKVAAKKKVVVRKKVAPKKQAASDEISLSALLEAKKLAGKLGGVEQAKNAISALAQLTD